MQKSEARETGGSCVLMYKSEWNRVLGFKVC